MSRRSCSRSSKSSSTRSAGDDTDQDVHAARKRFCRTSSLGEVGAIEKRPSPAQMRQLWEYDNRCANKYMGVPIRVCSSTEPPDQPGDHVLSEQCMSLMLSEIRNMWRRISTVWEIFKNRKPELGYRVRIKEDLPIKFSMKERDQIVVGWKASYPLGCPSQHLYERSDIEMDHQYMGGPVSYLNYASTNLSNIIVRQVSHGSAKHQVRAETKSALVHGTELFWDYGRRQMPDFNNGTWFNPECCSTVDRVNRRLAHLKDKMEVFEDLCVLCGTSYRANSRKDADRKAQKKVHFLNSHADFLGTDWDGLGDFDSQQFEVNYDLALLEAERLNRLLFRLHSDGWKVVPACVVLTKRELVGEHECVMNTFRNHCARLRRLGCVVLRGRTVPNSVEHLLPVRPSRWDKIFSKDKKPKRCYAMKEADKVANEDQLHEGMHQDIKMIMSLKLDYEDSSTDDDE